MVVWVQWSVNPDVSFAQGVLQLQMLEEQNWKDRSRELKRKNLTKTQQGRDTACYLTVKMLVSDAGDHPSQSPRA